MGTTSVLSPVCLLPLSLPTPPMLPPSTLPTLPAPLLLTPTLASALATTAFTRGRLMPTPPDTPTTSVLSPVSLPPAMLPPTFTLLWPPTLPLDTGPSMAPATTTRLKTFPWEDAVDSHHH